MEAGPVGLAAVGDLMLGDSAVCVGYGFRSRYGDADPTRLFAGVKPLFEGAGLVFGNLETVLSLSGLDPSSLSSAQMRGSPSFARALRHAGFDVVSVANNHANQHGADAYACEHEPQRPIRPRRCIVPLRSVWRCLWDGWS